MDLIPLVYFYKRKIYSQKDKSEISLFDLLDFLDKDSFVYVYDNDGVFRNKPNLCSYPKIAEKCKLWVDHSPRSLGDLVDAVLAGATNITFRRDLWPRLEFSKIREITECSIFEMLDLNTIIKNNNKIFSDLDGIVISSDKNTVDRDFILNDLIKNLCKKINVYIIESDKSLFSHWKNIGVKGLILELDFYKGVKSDGY